MFEEGIQEFWAWWNESGRIGLLAAVNGEESDIADVISAKVQELHPNLEWQLTPTAGGKYVFALSGGGTRLLRVLTETAMRWAPVDDDAVEYAASRVPVAGEVSFGNLTIDPGDVLVAAEIDDQYEQLDVEVWLPSVESVDEETHAEMALFLLDSVLGEDDTERWIGLVDVVDTPSPDSVPLNELHRVIADYATKVTGDGWAVYQRGPSPNEPVVVSVNVAAKHIDHLLDGIHLEFRISLREVTGLGMPSDEEADRVAEIEDQLLAALGSQATLVARETGLNQRILHLYGPDPDAMESAAVAFESHPTHDIAVTLAIDPDWAMIGQLV